MPFSLIISFDDLIRSVVVGESSNPDSVPRSLRAQLLWLSCNLEAVVYYIRNQYHSIESINVVWKTGEDFFTAITAWEDLDRSIEAEGSIKWRTWCDQWSSRCTRQRADDCRAPSSDPRGRLGPRGQRPGQTPEDSLTSNLDSRVRHHPTGWIHARLVSEPCNESRN